MSNYTQIEIKEMFSRRNADPDTRIVRTDYKTIGELPAAEEKWIWEGVIGQSVVFRSGDVADINDESLRRMVIAEIGSIKGEYTVSRKGEFTFFNCNFEVPL